MKKIRVQINMCDSYLKSRKILCCETYKCCTDSKTWQCMVNTEKVDNIVGITIDLFDILTE